MHRAAQKRRTVDQFAYWLSSQPFSPRTIETYTDQTTYFQRWLDDNALHLDQVTKDDLLDHFADLAAAGKSQSTISLRHAAVSKLYEYLIGRKVVSENPAADIPYRFTKRDSGQPYTQNEVRRMYQACRGWWERAVFMLLLGTGIRRNEVFAISRDDCNFDAGTLRVIRKGGAYQYLMPEPAVMHALEMALEFNDRLCPQKYDDCIPRLIQRLGNRANIPGRHHPHRLRFTMAVQWCEMGGQESELRVLLGHSSSRMTEYYSKVGRERRAMRSMQTMGIATKLLGDGLALGDIVSAG